MLCRAQIEELQQSLLLSMLPHDEEDEGNVILEVRSSVGGEWAGGFAADLLEMYRLFAAEQGWRFMVSAFGKGCGVGSVQGHRGVRGEGGQTGWECVAVCGRTGLALYGECFWQGLWCWECAVVGGVGKDKNRPPG